MCFGGCISILVLVIGRSLLLWRGASGITRMSSNMVDKENRGESLRLKQEDMLRNSEHTCLVHFLKSISPHRNGLCHHPTGIRLMWTRRSSKSKGV